jgi:hypothetical protein
MGFIKVKLIITNFLMGTDHGRKNSKKTLTKDFGNME